MMCNLRSDVWKSARSRFYVIILQLMNVFEEVVWVCGANFTALGKKLSFNLLICAFMFLYRFPEGSNVKSPLPGWVASAAIHLAFCIHPPCTVSRRWRRLPPIPCAVFTTRANFLLSSAVQLPYSTVILRQKMLFMVALKKFTSS